MKDRLLEHLIAFARSNALTVEKTMITKDDKFDSDGEIIFEVTFRKEKASEFNRGSLTVCVMSV